MKKKSTKILDGIVSRKGAKSQSEEERKSLTTNEHELTQIFHHKVHEEHEVFSAKSAQKKMPLENKFSRHFFFAYGRKKKCGCPYGLSEKIKNRKQLRLIYHRVNGFPNSDLQLPI